MDMQIRHDLETIQDQKADSYCTQGDLNREAGNYVAALINYQEALKLNREHKLALENKEKLLKAFKASDEWTKRAVVNTIQKHHDRDEKSVLYRNFGIFAGSQSKDQPVDELCKLTNVALDIRIDNPKRAQPGKTMYDVL